MKLDVDLEEVREADLRVSEVRAFCAKSLGWEWLHRCEERQEDCVAGE